LKPTRRQGSLARERSEWERAGERALSGIGPSPQTLSRACGRGSPNISVSPVVWTGEYPGSMYVV